ERLRTGHLVHQMQVNVENGRGIGGLGDDDVRVPNLLEKRLRSSHWRCTATDGPATASDSCAFTDSSHPNVSCVEPSNRPKNCCCSRSVTGPRRPLPTTILSTERTGVSSAAVPVRNISSAM